MKKRIQYRVLILLSVVLCYCLLTPIGALRASVLFCGYPIEAVTLQARESTPQDVGLGEFDNPDSSKIYTITKNVPYEQATGGYLENWIVYKFLCFHFAGHYGYC